MSHKAPISEHGKLTTLIEQINQDHKAGLLKVNPDQEAIDIYRGEARTRKTSLSENLEVRSIAIATDVYLHTRGITAVAVALNHHHNGISPESRDEGRHDLAVEKVKQMLNSAGVHSITNQDVSTITEIAANLSRGAGSHSVLLGAR